MQHRLHVSTVTQPDHRQLFRGNVKQKVFEKRSLLYVGRFTHSRSVFRVLAANTFHGSNRNSENEQQRKQLLQEIFRSLEQSALKAKRQSQKDSIKDAKKDLREAINDVQKVRKQFLTRDRISNLEKNIELFAKNVKKFEEKQKDKQIYRNIEVTGPGSKKNSNDSNVKVQFVDNKNENVDEISKLGEKQNDFDKKINEVLNNDDAVVVNQEDEISSGKTKEFLKFEDTNNDDFETQKMEENDEVNNLKIENSDVIGQEEQNLSAGVNQYTTQLRKNQEDFEKFVSEHPNKESFFAMEEEDEDDIDIFDSLDEYDEFESEEIEESDKSCEEFESKNLNVNQNLNKFESGNFESEDKFGDNFIILGGSNFEDENSGNLISDKNFGKNSNVDFRNQKDENSDENEKLNPNKNPNKFESGSFELEDKYGENFIILGGSNFENENSGKSKNDENFGKNLNVNFSNQKDESKVFSSGENQDNNQTGFVILGGGDSLIVPKIREEKYQTKENFKTQFESEPSRNISETQFKYGDENQNLNYSDFKKANIENLKNSTENSEESLQKSQKQSSEQISNDQIQKIYEYDDDSKNLTLNPEQFQKLYEQLIQYLEQTEKFIYKGEENISLQKLNELESRIQFLRDDFFEQNSQIQQNQTKLFDQQEFLKQLDSLKTQIEQIGQNQVGGEFLKRKIKEDSDKISDLNEQFRNLVIDLQSMQNLKSDLLKLQEDFENDKKDSEISNFVKEAEDLKNKFNQINDSQKISSNVLMERISTLEKSVQNFKQDQMDDSGENFDKKLFMQKFASLFLTVQNLKENLNSLQNQSNLGSEKYTQLEQKLDNINDQLQQKNFDEKYDYFEQKINDVQFQQEKNILLKQNLLEEKIDNFYEDIKKQLQQLFEQQQYEKDGYDRQLSSINQEIEFLKNQLDQKTDKNYSESQKLSQDLIYEKILQKINYLQNIIVNLQNYVSQEDFQEFKTEILSNLEKVVKDGNSRENQVQLREEFEQLKNENNISKNEISEKQKNLIESVSKIADLVENFSGTKQLEKFHQKNVEIDNLIERVENLEKKQQKKQLSPEKLKILGSRVKTFFSDETNKKFPDLKYKIEGLNFSNVVTFALSDTTGFVAVTTDDRLVASGQLPDGLLNKIDKNSQEKQIFPKLISIGPKDFYFCVFSPTLSEGSNTLNFRFNLLNVKYQNNKLFSCVAFYGEKRGFVLLHEKDGLITSPPGTLPESLEIEIINNTIENNSEGKVSKRKYRKKYQFVSISVDGCWFVKYQDGSCVFDLNEKYQKLKEFLSTCQDVCQVVFGGVGDAVVRYEAVEKLDSNDGNNPIVKQVTIL